jgi:heme exporter protein D
MMPDLGDYRVEVLAAYAASIAILVLIIGSSLWRYVRVKAAMERMETEQDG